MQHLYFIGLDQPLTVGLAIAAKKLGFAVSGSGANPQHWLNQHLAQAGIHYHQSYDKHHLHNDAIVVLAPHIPASNPELKQAQAIDLEIVSTSQLIQQLTHNQFRIVVVGSSLTAMTTATLLNQPADSTVDIISNLPMSQTAYWPQQTTVSLTGQPLVVIDAQLDPASSLDKASQVLYYQPQQLVLVEDPDRPWSSKQLAIIDHVLKDMAQANKNQAQLSRAAQAARVFTPQTNPALLTLVKKSGLSYATYGQAAADWQAKKVDFLPEKTVFWLFKNRQQQDMLTSPLLGAQGLYATVLSLAIADTHGQDRPQSLLRLGQVSGSTWHRSISLSQDRKLELIDIQPLFRIDYAYHLANVINRSTSKQAKTWLVVNQVEAKDMAALLQKKHLANVDILITDISINKSAKWLQAMPHYQMTIQRLGQFLRQNSQAEDTIIVCSRQPHLHQLQHALVAALQ